MVEEHEHASEGACGPGGSIMKGWRRGGKFNEMVRLFQEEAKTSSLSMQRRNNPKFVLEIKETI